MNESIFINDLVLNKTKALKQFPDKAVAEFFIDEMFRFLFIGSEGEWNHSVALEKHRQLKNTFASLVSETVRDEAEVRRHATEFFYQLPVIYKALLNDAYAPL